MSFTGIHAGKSTHTHKVKIQNVKTDSVSRDNKVLCPLNSSSADQTVGALPAHALLVCSAV